MRDCSVYGYRLVSKAAARRMYNDGKVVYLCPSFLRPGSMWHPEVAVTKMDLSQASEEASYFVSNTRDFDKLVDEFMYYNCRSGVGRYPAYYIKES